ncbi:protein VASCULAR ASSOCIATED DEATH 1, chloroplastic-like [Impatiens glandulifera]|uniref:protein VASCULAR ASSOCIATED DEATH 1, chloroplastic-like n=1 Tax=Impatiens glandulifera TaxID=253017 RepID=UPI001FB0C7DC|nr:protein VASCULAR ASSOCIATED DEATH 1, chloroplastic-like [Impatiens glandulifera]XP_047324700.1 protein VASCULAR ASSOCIATED DEATH 1, chloroplastic-like [Impatiens glandulifera]XP_047324701.1 protein VASCULAR ASSOCIATED DEATH 1, chloroplastic-like [Impatiens glandulifera]XP_047324702.1 protein VASCULAR ASSOCIATED DEATH 1, chloroplastic-like [Impatiens glandulifera]XP_047324703.1 protein VASCULAR ASSOCIATED DEATH 1, chloroplastic-like [Impatiens glandulifera]XP_047324704.1 protein VASCULAR ASS
MVGQKKFFFSSFLSRDDGSQHGQQSELQDMPIESTSGTNGIGINGEAENSEILREDLEPSERDDGISMPEEYKTPIEGEAKSVPDPLEVQETLEEYVETVTDLESLSSQKDPKWVYENCEAPKVPQSYVKIAEAIFPLKVEEFFILFFSEEATDFVKSYHESCKDKDFRVSSWHTHNEFGHARDVFFQHPINIYFGAKFCSCQEVQKYRVYRDSHLVIETSQVVRDVPYGDYFSVEGLWDVERDENNSNSCTLRFYVGVDFSKKTMWKGKIEQSTMDEARETYSTWRKNADELLKQKNVEKEAFMHDADNVIPNGEANEERLPSQRSVEHGDVKQPADDTLNRSRGRIVSSLAESLVKLYSYIKSQSEIPVLLIVVFALILLVTQMSIVVLLSRAQEVKVIPESTAAEYMRSSSCDSSGTILDKKVQNVKEEMFIIETMVEKMRGEHGLLKAQLRELEKMQLITRQKKSEQCVL